jgi:hypothetical protein
VSERQFICKLDCVTGNAFIKLVGSSSSRFSITFVRFESDGGCVFYDARLADSSRLIVIKQTLPARADESTPLTPPPHQFV